MTTARKLLEDLAQVQLNDPKGENWSLTELLRYLNDGLQLMVQYVPHEFSKVKTDTLVAGAEQSLPAQGVELVEILANVNANDTYADVPFETTKRSLSLGDPAWRQASPGTAKEWAKDPSSPTTYWVSPPAAAGNKVEIEYIEHPSTLVINGVLPIHGDLEPALADYVLYRAFSKDTDYAGEAGLSTLHYNSFLSAVGGGSHGES